MQWLVAGGWVFLGGCLRGLRCVHKRLIDWQVRVCSGHASGAEADDDYEVGGRREARGGAFWLGHVKLVRGSAVPSPSVI